MRPWYTKIHIWVTIMISATAAAVAGLAFLLMPSPDEIVLMMQARMVRLRGFGIETRVNFDGSTGKTGDAARPEIWRLDSRGTINRTDPVSPRIKQDFSLQTSLGGDSLTKFAGEFRQTGGTGYVRFTDLPDRFGNVNFAPYRDRWLAFTWSRLRRMLDLPLMGAAGEISDLDRAYLENQFAETPFFRVTERLDQTKIAGVPVYHFQVSPQTIFIKDYVMRMEALRLGRELIAKERDALDVFFANVTPDDGELWIGKRDFRLYRMRLRFHYDGPDRRGVLDIAADFSLHDQAVEIDPPAGETVNVEPIVRSLLPGLTGRLPVAAEGGQQIVTGGLPVGLTVGAEESDPDPDKDGLPNSLEFFYMTDPNNPDTDGDGVSDGDEVARGDNPTGPGKLFDFGIGR